MASDEQNEQPITTDEPAPFVPFIHINILANGDVDIHMEGAIPLAAMFTAGALLTRHANKFLDAQDAMSQRDVLAVARSLSGLPDAPNGRN